MEDERLDGFRRGWRRWNRRFLLYTVMGESSLSDLGGQSYVRKREGHGKSRMDKHCAFRYKPLGFGQSRLQKSCRARRELSNEGRHMSVRYLGPEI